MKVVHLTTLHEPTDVRIWFKECRTLAASGFDTVLLARVKRPEQRDGVAVRPIGTLEVRLGIPSLSRRLWKAFRRALRERADLYHLHDPELVLVGFALKLRGKRVVYDAHEDTPREVVALDPHGRRATRFLGLGWAAVLWLAGRTFDGVVAATPTIAERYPPAKTVLVRNFPVATEFDGPGGAQRSRPPEVVYAGALHRLRGMDVLLEAIGLVGHPDATLVLAGPSQPPAYLDELKARPEWERVRYEGVVSRARVAELFRAARAGLVVFRPDVTHLDALPNKLFEYMAAGLPVIASDFPRWRELVEGSGLLVDPEDAASVASAIEWVLAHPDEADELGARGRERVLTTANWEHEGERLLELYARLSA